MRTSLRATVAGVATLSLVALMAGCVSGGTTEPDSNTTHEEASSGTAGATDEQTVVFWGWNVFDQEGTVAAFEAENPDIKVEFKQYAYNDYVTAIRTGLTSKDGPDVFQLQPGELVENFGPLAVDLAPQMNEEYGANWQDMFYEEGLTQLQFDDRQVGLPSYMSAAGFLYYNADILEEVGASVPTDFDEWKEVCATLQGAGYDCLAHGGKDAWVNLDVYLALVNSIAPGAVYDAIDGKSSWTDPEFVEAMTAWKDMFDTGIIPAGSAAMAEYPDAFTEFLEGRAVFIALGTWNTPGTMTKTGVAESQKTVTETIDSVFLSTPFPSPEAGGTPTAPFGGPDNGWAISQNASNPSAAAKLLDFLAVSGGQEIQAAGGNIPGVVDIKVATDDVIDPRQVADIEGQQAALQNLIGARQIVYPELANALGDALSAVAAGSTTPEAAMEQVESVSASLSR